MINLADTKYQDSHGMTKHMNVPAVVSKVHAMQIVCMSCGYLIVKDGR